MTGLLKRLSVGLAILLWASPAAAADEYLYVVNAAGKPIALMIDGRWLPEMAPLMAVAFPASVGEHILMARPDGQSPIIVNLQRNDAIQDPRQRSFWCFIVGDQPGEGLKIISTDRPTCAELIVRGINGAPLNSDSAP
jgi:hypothetical protein